jgi:acetyl-CoA acetyltransferase
MRHSVAITGVGYGPIGRNTDHSEASLAATACRQAIADAGLTTDHIDGLSMFPAPSTPPVPFSGPPLQVTQRSLGLQNLGYIQSFGIESGQFGPILAATYALEAGIATHILVLRAHKRQHRRYLPHISSMAQAWDEDAFTAPYGAAGGAGRAAMLATRHMHEYGTTQEQFGAVAILAREHAKGNPLAVWRDKQITMAEYMAADWIATPFKLYDCDYPIDGAVAIVVSRADRAADTRHAVWVEGVGQSPGPDTERLHRLSYTDTAPRAAAKQMWSRTSLKPADVDVAEIYDGFSASAIAWLEDAQLVPEGAGGPFFGEGRGRLGGPRPWVLTDGGQLGGGRLHGFGKLAQSVKQLRAEAGANQAPDVNVALACSGAQSVASLVLLTKERQ